MAGQTAQVLNLSRAGADLGIDRRTLEGYARLLEDLFLLQRLPAWGTTLRARAASSPKVHVVDSGLAARLLRLNPSKLARLDASTLTEFGHLPGSPSTPVPGPTPPRTACTSFRSTGCGGQCEPARTSRSVQTSNDTQTLDEVALDRARSHKPRPSRGVVKGRMRPIAA